MVRRSIRGPIYMGLDLSLSSSGMVLLEGGKPILAKLLPTKPKAPHYRRIEWICAQVMQNATLHRPKLIGVEDYAHGANQGAHISGEVGGQVRLELLRAGFTVVVVPVAVIKKFATDRGNAQKAEMLLHVFKRWGFETRSHDLADAFTIAKCVEAIGEGDGSKRAADALKKMKELQW